MKSKKLLKSEIKRLQGYGCTGGRKLDRVLDPYIQILLDEQAKRLAELEQVQEESLPARVELV